MKIKKTLPSGAVLECDLAPFKDGYALLKAVMRELEATKISIGLKSKSIKDIFDIELTDDALNTLKNVITSIVSSEQVEAMLWACMGRATYNNQRITEETFEDISARSDYLIVMKEVMLHNVSPFFKSLGSLWSGQSAQTSDCLR